MGKAAQAKDRTARDRLAAQRAAERRKAAARHRLLVAGGGVLAVIALVVGFIVIKSGQRAPAAAGSSTNSQIAKELGGVSTATFDAVGKGDGDGLQAISGDPVLTQDGKPELLYMGGEWCPYCAAERWAMATAVSRFGTLTAPNLIHSSPTDSYPNTPTLSFIGSGYTSKYIAFDPVEWQGENHQVLQQPTAAEQALFNQYANDGFPFVDIGNRYLSGPQYNPGDLAGLTWSQIATDMKNPSSTVAKDIDGSANILTAALCKATGGQPGNVCSSAGVKAAAGSL